MDRINVYEPASYDSDDGTRPKLAGWFDYDKAERFPEDTEWDGSNHISVATGSQWHHEQLLRTKQGRWVLHTYSSYQGVSPAFAFAGDKAAREWLIRNSHDEDVARFFGELPEEQGPGRPEVGGAVHVRLGDQLGRVDAYAAKVGINRAEAVRRLVSAGLDWAAAAAV